MTDLTQGKQILETDWKGRELTDLTQGKQILETDWKSRELTDLKLTGRVEN